AIILVQEGFTSTEEIAYVPEEELLAIEEFDEDIVAELRSRARDYLLTRAISAIEGSDQPQPAADLLAVDGMNDELAATLADNEIVTLDDLADLGVDELVEITSMGEQQAGDLIMAARAHWFVDEQANAE